jgi:RNA polymerase sigma-70 factor (TIGR02960 family)
MTIETNSNAAATSNDDFYYETLASEEEIYLEETEEEVRSFLISDPQNSVLMVIVDVLQFEQYRPALLGHCYRMLGSAFDADDAVQETIIRAWRSYDGFDGRSSLKSWLYRIATNVCFDELKKRNRRGRPIEEGDPSSGAPALEELKQKPDSYWIEPILDSEICDPDAGPDEKASLRQCIRLAFVAALQKLPPKQRAAVLMSEVLEYSVAEVAEALETSAASVNSALQRARGTRRLQRRSCRISRALGERPATPGRKLFLT